MAIEIFFQRNIKLLLKVTHINQQKQIKCDIFEHTYNDSLNIIQQSKIHFMIFSLEN